MISDLHDGHFAHAYHARFARRVNASQPQLIAVHPKSAAYVAPSRLDLRGVTANRHETSGAGCDGRQGVERASFRADERQLADGEVVWSWRPWAGAKFAG